jgi:hypothetical protein
MSATRASVQAAEMDPSGKVSSVRNWVAIQRVKTSEMDNNLRRRSAMVSAWEREPQRTPSRSRKRTMLRMGVVLYDIRARES